MKRYFFYAMLLAAMVLTIAVIAYAAATNPQDTYATVGSSAIRGDEDDLYVKAGVPSSYPLVCETMDITYLRWDLDQVNGEASASGPNKTQLILNANYTYSTSQSKLYLYKITDDNWTESTLNGNNAPALGDLIMQVPAPTTPGSVIFEGSALADWINENSSYVGGNDTVAGNDIVSFAITIDCTSIYSHIKFDSKEKDGGTPPALNIYDPNAVRLSSFSTTQQQSPWSFYVGLGVLILVVSIGYRIFNKLYARM